MGLSLRNEEHVSREYLHGTPPITNRFFTFQLTLHKVSYHKNERRARRIRMSGIVSNAVLIDDAFTMSPLFRSFTIILLIFLAFSNLKDQMELRG